MRPDADPAALVTLLTDFGTADYFVGAMKGVILSRNPSAVPVDITHEIPPQDVNAAAFTLLAAYPAFPAGTVHLAVVDPGVGSARRAIAAEAGGQFFVAPDNGLLSYVLEREPVHRVVHVTREALFLHPVSNTFHGRDVFAPVAAELARAGSVDSLGEEVPDYQRLEPLRPVAGDDGRWHGSIIHIDRFGNCVTNLTRAELPDAEPRRGVVLHVAGTTIRELRRFYAEEAAEGKVDESFAIWGSAGFLEIATYGGSAARLLGVERGVPLIVEPA